MRWIITCGPQRYLVEAATREEAEKFWRRKTGIYFLALSVTEATAIDCEEAIDFFRNHGVQIV
jgi:hypothetical protein